ncbi:uncharacterized protein J3D65DRAFT_682175 [Phyllosticta citribraziliensis]|uniref:Uncharacterized protein n=1 Tax=Phyllosticta citribraziliensis TaxID=989973 RepID=A0ABR1M9Q0_9PEZI
MATATPPWSQLNLQFKLQLVCSIEGLLYAVIIGLLVFVVIMLCVNALDDTAERWTGVGQHRRAYGQQQQEEQRTRGRRVGRQIVPTLWQWIALWVRVQRGEIGVVFEM